MPVISSKFQVVIPQHIREKFDFKVGDNIEFIPVGTGLHVARKRPMKEYEGFLKGKITDTTIERDEDDRLEGY